LEIKKSESTKNPTSDLRNVIFNLEEYISNNNFSGYDPYDGLRSRIINHIPLRSKYLKIAWIQFFKLMPINLRSIFLIDKGINPKGMGLFLSSYTNLYRITKDKIWLNKAEYICKWLIENRSKNYSNYCWGYNFDWQNRAFYLPKFTPTIVNTSFIGHSILDLYKITKDKKLLEIVKSSCEFIVKDLNRFETDSHLCFSYTPIDYTRVHNASILGAGLLARFSKITLNDNYDEIINKCSNYLIYHQKDDGGWVYAQTNFQGWVDSFHTGFNLFSLKFVNKKLNDDEVRKSIKLGTKFYEENFFLNDGAPKYYNNKTFPLDIHSSAMGLVYFSDINLKLATKIYEWMVNNMLDNDGYFYFRKNKFFKNKISYMRWVQAWAFFGLTKYSLHER
jgi:hypothetical protein